MTRADAAGSLPAMVYAGINRPLLGDLAGLAHAVPKLATPVPPPLAKLLERVMLPPESQALGVPAGCTPDLAEGMAERVAGLPDVPLTQALPALGTLATLQHLATGRLGFAMPSEAPELAQVMRDLPPEALAPASELAAGPLAGLATLVALGAALKERLGVDPEHPEASRLIEERLPERVPAYGTYAADGAGAAAGMDKALGVGMLYGVSEALGVKLDQPGGVQKLADRVRELNTARLPVIDLDPDAAGKLYPLSQIHKHWPLDQVARDPEPFRRHIAALLKLDVEVPPAGNGTPGGAGLPPQPTAETVRKVLDSDLGEISRADWGAPELPVTPAIPGLAALAQLQDMLPVIRRGAVR
ncbi:hypothetical protein [Falsiroseomonas oryzae]|uniref:hypothetical protein n=1 Tax=Falsiroseomonas oryzae TaxID=2766473 RepID=UPI0022EB9615|nr:hypothetical protein [Roseomonas sp. MO-31]